MFKAADSDGDGEISFDEFKAIMRAGPDAKPSGGLLGGITGGLGGGADLIMGARGAWTVVHVRAVSTAFFISVRGGGGGAPVWQLLHMWLASRHGRV